MIRSFRSKETRDLFEDRRSRRFQSIERAARRKLLYLDAASSLEDLMQPPGNCLEALRGNRLGQYSIRINDQRRICFRWEAEFAEDVEIVDYH